MKEILLTQGRVVIVDDEDFEHLSKSKWGLSNGYATRRLKRQYFDNREPLQRDQKMHRLLMGEPKLFQIDHINGNKLDNRKANLRLATPQQNKFNRPKTSKNKSGFKGVCWSDHSNGWRAQIKIDSKNKFLGTFKSAHEAALAYDVAATLIHREFALTNFGVKP